MCERGGCTYCHAWQCDIVYTRIHSRRYWPLLSELAELDRACVSRVLAPSRYDCGATVSLPRASSLFVFSRCDISLMGKHLFLGKQSVEKIAMRRGWWATIGISALFQHAAVACSSRMLSSFDTQGFGLGLCRRGSVCRASRFKPVNWFAVRISVEASRRFCSVRLYY